MGYSDMPSTLQSRDSQSNSATHNPICTHFCQFNVNQVGKYTIKVEIGQTDISLRLKTAMGCNPMQFTFLRRSRRNLLLQIIRKLVLVGVILAVVPLNVGASSIVHRDIFVGASARAVGMGSAFTAGPSANNGFLWNPSSLGFMEGAEVNMGGMPFARSTSSSEQAFSVAANPNALGITDRNFGNLSFATWLDGWGSNITESTQIVLLGYGFAFGQNASAGANLRYYQNNTPIRTNFLWSVDLGMQFAYPLEKWGDTVRVGLNFSELSNGIREDGVLLESIPLAARFGTTYELGKHTLFSADFAVRGENNINWGERLRFHVGAERWLINGHFGLRLGYTTLTAYDTFWNGELARGFSFRNSIGQLDYAYVTGSELEQNIHWLSATLRWGGSAAKPVSTATPPEVVKTDETPAAPILMPATLTPTVTPETSVIELQLSAHTISPNNDGIADNTTLRFGDNSQQVLKWQLNIRDEYTESIWEKSGIGVPTAGIVWDGIANTGSLVPDGNYEVELRVLDAQGKPQLKDSEKLVVDLMPTTLELSRKTPTTVGVKTWDMSPLAHWKLEIFDTANTLIEQLDGEGSPPDEIVLSKVKTQPVATYTCKLHVQDIAGNQSTQQAELQLGTESQPASAPTTPTKTLTLMVGSFAEPHNAEMMAENLRLLIPDEKVEIYTVDVDARTLHRVTIGEFKARAEAAELKQHIQETQGIDPVLITVQ